MLTQGYQRGEFIVSPANGQRSFSNVTVTIAGAEALKSGQVLGKITATGKYVKHDVAGTDDGRRTALAVLLTDLPGTNGDYEAVVVARDCEVDANVMNEGAGVATLAATELSAVGIIVRS